MEAQLPLRDARGELWRGGVAKFFADGVIDSGTAWLEEPDTHGAGTEPFWPDPARFAARSSASPAQASRSRRTRSATPPCASRSRVHAAGAAPGVRHRLEHLETLPDDLVAKIPAAGVAASMQPVHLDRGARRR